MNGLIRSLLCVALFAICGAALAKQQPVRDGNWVKKGADAFDRVSLTTYLTEASVSDIHDTDVLFAYIEGMLAVHRQNNLMAGMLIYAANSGRDETLPKDEKVGTALLFTPLIRVPDAMSAKQVVAILQKYLDENPGKWGDSAPIVITHAFEDAFKK